MWKKRRIGSKDSVLFDKTDDKSNDGNDCENEEQNFRNFNCASSYPAKAKDSGNECNQQKNHGIVQHERLFGYKNRSQLNLGCVQINAYFERVLTLYD